MKNSTMVSPRDRLCIALVVAALLPGAALAQKKPGRIEVNGIAAKVNGRVVTKNEVALTLAPMKAKLEELFPERGPEFELLVEESRKAAIKELIDRLLLIDQFKGPEIRIPDEAVRKEFQRQIREDYQGDEDKLRDALKACRMTVDGYRTMIRERLTAEEIMRRQDKED